MTALAIILAASTIGFLLIVIGRSIIPGCKQDFSGDFAAAFTLLASLGIVMVVAILSGTTNTIFDIVFTNVFGSTIKEVFPFFECINNSYDVLTLIRSDFTGFVEELVKLLFLTIGMELLSQFLPTSYGLTGRLGIFFLNFTTRFLYLAILAFVYHHLTAIGVIQKIVSFLVPLLAMALPVPAVVNGLSVKNNRHVVFGTGFVIGLLCAHFRVIWSSLAYMIVISYVSTHYSSVTETLHKGLTTFLVISPSIIVVIGIIVILKSTINVRRH